jgi:hypothetical protein
MSMILHCGARQVGRDELDRVNPPEPTRTWFPVKHAEVVDAVMSNLRDQAFVVRDVKYALARQNHRMFATLDLASPLAAGVTLAVGVRNSTDKSLPLGFCAGSRVFCCDNLAFHSELLVHRKHTRHGRERFVEAICLAVRGLAQFKENESRRIELFRMTDVDDRSAESLILRAYDQEVITTPTLPKVIKEWREPSFEDFLPRTLWSLFNAFTTALGGRQKSDPQRFAKQTIALQALIGREFRIESTPDLTTAV